MKVLVVTAMYPTPENPAFGSFVKTQVDSLRGAGVDVEVLVLRGRFRKLIYPIGALKLRRRLRDHPVDLVHAHYGLVGLVGWTQRSVPLVVTFHGDDLLGTVNKSGRTTLASRLIVAAGKLLGRSADAAIVQSEQMARVLARPGTHIVPHEVDFDLFRPAPKDEARRLLGLDREKTYLLFPANPQTHVKRYPLARDVVEHLRKEGVEVELCVIYKETQARLALYMSACDALVFPSYQEGSPNVVKQAMACGLPIVATDVGDVRQVIAGVDGCFVCQPTIEAFVEKLQLIFKRDERTKGREAIGRFAPGIVTARLLAVYEETLAHSREHHKGSSRLVSQRR